LFAITALSPLAAGCASLPSSPAASTDAGIALEMRSNALVFLGCPRRIHAPGASQVRGTLRRIGHRPVRAGHIDYQLSDAGGRVLEQGQTSDGGATGRPHPGHASTFVIPLQMTWIPGQRRLYLKWHAGAHTDSPS
jgi:hypothetical protein